METKIDYVAILKPLEKILSNDTMKSEDKIKMSLEIIRDLLKQAEAEE